MYSEFYLKSCCTNVNRGWKLRALMKMLIILFLIHNLKSTQIKKFESNTKTVSYKHFM